MKDVNKMSEREMRAEIRGNRALLELAIERCQEVILESDRHEDKIIWILESLEGQRPLN